MAIRSDWEEAWSIDDLDTVLYLLTFYAFGWAVSAWAVARLSCWSLVPCARAGEGALGDDSERRGVLRGGGQLVE